jgi:hypothetical protein
MRSTLAALLLTLTAATASADHAQLSPREAANATRVCTPAGDPVRVTTSTTASARSAALEVGVTYWIYPTTATYLAVGGSDVTASTVSFPLPVVLFPILTTSASRYVSARAVSEAGIVYLWPCK